MSDEAKDRATQRTIDALLHERAGLERQGKTDRVAQVDEQLRLRGYSVDAPAAPKAARGQRTARA